MTKDDEIRLIAYSIWEQEGYVDGKDVEHWFRAEAIWEEQQKPEAVSPNTKTQPERVASETKKVMAREKRE